MNNFRRIYDVIFSTKSNTNVLQMAPKKRFKTRMNIVMKKNNKESTLLRKPFRRSPLMEAALSWRSITLCTYKKTPTLWKTSEGASVPSCTLPTSTLSLNYVHPVCNKQWTSSLDAATIKGFTSKPEEDGIIGYNGLSQTIRPFNALIIKE